MKKFLQTEIILVRHGETDMNKNNLYFGHLDPSLNETGKKQLERSKCSLRKIENVDEISQIYCSPLKRCVESLDILEISKNININYDDDFKELNFGIFEGKTYKEICENYPEEVKRMKVKWRTFKVEGSESLEELEKRVVSKLEEIFEAKKGKKILLVAHAGVIKILLSHYLVGNVDLYWKLKIDNGAISKIVKLEDGFVYVDYVNRI